MILNLKNQLLIYNFTLPKIVGEWSENDEREDLAAISTSQKETLYSQIYLVDMHRNK